LQRHEVYQVKLYLLLMPIVSALIGVLFLGETLTVRAACGIAVVLCGAGLLLLKGRIGRKAPLQP
ncbi:MAG: EamA family transporter, partial [Clostridia bacterium]|nr:EamA family transporter [Clostridia bacterium]